MSDINPPTWEAVRSLSEQLDLARAEIANLRDEIVRMRGGSAKDLKARLRLAVQRQRWGRATGWAVSAMTALYSARGVLGIVDLAEAINSACDPEHARIGVHQARAVMPGGSIETVRGHGYLMTQIGRAHIKTLLSTVTVEGAIHDNEIGNSVDARGY